MKILNIFGDKFANEAKELLNKIGDVDYLSQNSEQIKSNIHKYDIVICDLSVNFSRSILEKAVRLKYLCTPTTGLDHIDISYCKEKGIVVLSLKNEIRFLESITGTSELALGLLISLVRHIPKAYGSVLSGKWDREEFYGHSLNSKTIGIIGMGRLGSKMAKYCEAMGMKVVFFDPFVEQIDKKYKKVSFNTLVSNSDFVSLHLHLNEYTEMMINENILNKTKKGVYIVNTSRGRIVDESAMIKAIKNGHVAGYAADVVDGELNFLGKDCSNHPLVKFAKKNEKVLLSPHIGGVTYESRHDTDMFIVKMLGKHIK